ncbi:Fatty acid 2-hydroxylase 1 [Hibiscus syriacus]|uniref:Fatty acid 2-hydroxylase 1 n=1 Tax=Hibiscus syriacus TaxID=106335 RepID=A0A6A2X0Y1_HIBSY|nr:Fatty acid 2-hydroxylase 1 [Hibiscus syriacus]
MAGKGFIVDLNKPLVFQVGHLGEAYQEWVHTPILTEESPQFFESGFAEFLSRTTWWVVPVVWMPVAFYFIGMSYTMGLTLPLVAMLSVSGAFVWTFLEYCIHRFLFHIVTKSYWGNTFHYLIHGFHHKHPMDGLRLVIPPLEAAIVLGMFWYLCRLLFTLSMGSALLGGGLSGYVMYDTTHYYLHHGHPTSKILKSLKKYHMNHHFRIQNKGFGVTTTLWDRVFETLPKTKSAEESK